MKAFITLILAILCSTSIALADTYTGTTGDCTYTLDTSDSTLVISGSGAMEDDYAWYIYVPWYDYRSYVKTATIEDGVTSIGTYAFYNCTSLTSITIPDGVTSIGLWAFYGCSSLTSITIPNGVTSISQGTFEYCSSLTSITIPESVTSIGIYAFNDCTSLTSITSLNTTPPTIYSSTFSDYSATLYAASTDYATADYWENFTNIVYDTSGNAISSVTASTSTIRTAGSAIVITTETAQTVQVYSLAGQLIVKQAVSAGETSIGMLTGGVYVVALNDGTKAKVLVK